MELTILTSRKGTRVVKATDLHRCLGLADHHYQANVRNWLRDVYQFADGIRTPEGMKDYARSSKTKTGVVQEYYFNLELARLITLASKSKVKQAIANKIAKSEAAFPDRVQLTPEETLQLLELTKAMARLTCQEAAEERHLAAYVRRRGNADYWNRFRVDNVTRVRTEEIREQLKLRGIAAPSTLRVRDLLLRYAPLECIRIAVVDHYAGKDFPLPYANQMGDLAHKFAESLRLEVVDDRQGESLFAPVAEESLVQRLQRAA